MQEKSRERVTGRSSFVPTKVLQPTSVRFTDALYNMRLPPSLNFLDFTHARLCISIMHHALLLWYIHFLATPGPPRCACITSHHPALQYPCICIRATCTPSDTTVERIPCSIIAGSLLGLAWLGGNGGDGDGDGGGRVGGGPAGCKRCSTPRTTTTW